MIYKQDGIVNDIRRQIAEDATLEEYQALIEGVGLLRPTMSTYERRGKEVIKKWEGEVERRKAIEDKFLKVTPEVAGRLVFEQFSNSIDILKKR
jgi:hypothetical protein